MIDWEQISFQIIAFAGEAKGHAINAIKAAKEGNFDKAEQLIKDSEKSRIEASHAHMDVISKEAQGEKLQIPLLFMHAEDQMMNTETITILAKEMIEMYKKII